MTFQKERLAVATHVQEATEGTFLAASSFAGNSNITFDGDSPPVWSVDPTVIERNPARAGLTALTPRISSQIANFSYTYEVKGVGVGKITQSGITAAGEVTATAHGLVTGEAVVISHSPDAGSDGAWRVSVSDANTFQLVGHPGGVTVDTTTSEIRAAPPEHYAMIMSGHQAHVTSTFEAPTTTAWVAGETLTQDSTGATCVFIRETSTAGTFLVAAVSDAGSLPPSATDPWVGASSAVSGTPTTVPVARGVVYRPDSAAPSFSTYFYAPYGTGDDGHEFHAAGCRANLTLAAADGDSYMLATMNVVGKMHAKTEGSGVAVPQNIPYSATLPFPFNDHSYRVGDVTSTNICNQGFQFASNYELSPVKCDNVSGNLKSFLATARNPEVGQFSPALDESVSFYDEFNDPTSRTDPSAYWKLGTAANDIVEFYAPNTRIKGYGTGGRDGVRILELPYGCYGAGSVDDNEYWIEYR